MGNKHDILEVCGIFYHARGIMTPPFIIQIARINDVNIYHW